MEFETVIGLEIHAQLLTETKIFCSCRAEFGAEPNTQGCPVCLGMPGALPVLNRKAVKLAVMTGHALGCTINHKSIFARKNYFYPDLPKGYQISQYEMPLCENGVLSIEDSAGRAKAIRIKRIHLEEDAGKLIHDQGPYSLFDVNRCGTPLIEIVTEPDISGAAEAFAFLTALRRILLYLRVCDCNMEEGSLRCDANISLRRQGEAKLGVKTELKNMNSFRSVERALEYEAARQRTLLLSGGTIEQQTFEWDEKSQRTSPMRSKEEAHDYRYFPDPDLVPLVLAPSWIEECKKLLPELPPIRRARFVSHFGLNPEHADVLTDTRDTADYFEAVIAAGADVRLAATWVMGEVLRLAKEKKCSVNHLHLSPKRLAKTLLMMAEGSISALAAKTVVDAVEREDVDPAVVVDRRGLRQISNENVLAHAVDTVLAQYPKEVARFKQGETKLIGFFMGQIMKATAGKGNPKEINRILIERLR